MSVEQPPGTPAATDDARVALLRASYDEVLDATKHQDDKIGRLLTAIAFLTAAALALANLTSRDTLTRGFRVSVGAHRHAQALPPLVLVALAVFLICIVFSVVLLVGSLATPLRIPGLAPGRREPRDASQLYFYDIAARGWGAWLDMWRRDPAELARDVPPMYVRESYNLATRTDFKYARTNEAVAVFAFGLLAFAATAVLALGAAAAPCGRTVGTRCVDRVELDLVLRAALCALLGLYTLVQLLSQFRYNHMTVDEARNLVGDVRDAEWRTGLRQRLFILTAAAGAGLPAATPFVAPGSSGTVLCVVDACCLVVAGAEYARVTYAGRRPGRRQRERDYTFLVVVAGLAASLALVLTAEATGRYAAQLLAGAVVPAGITLAALVGPTGHAAERRVRYREVARARDGPREG